MALLESTVDERRTTRTAADRFRSLAPFAVAWTAAVVLLGVVAAQRAVPMEDLLLDSAAVGGQPWYAGLVTSLGVLAWTVTVCGCAATAFVTNLGRRPAAVRAFRGAAFFFSVLLLDDLFQLHSELLPSITGLPKATFLLAEAALAWLWLVPAIPELRRTRWELLAASAVAFALSLAVDAGFNDQGPWWLLAEDGPKFLGVVALATWSALSATDVIRSVVVTR